MYSSQNHGGPAFSSALPVLLLLTSVFFVNFLARTIFGPLLLPITKELDLGLAQGSTIFLCLSLGYSGAVFCAGFLSQRLGHKGTIVVSVSGLGLALLGLASSTTLTSFLIWTLAMGGAAGLYIPSSVVTITEATAPAHWGQAFSVHELAPNLSFILAPLVAELFLDTMGYPPLFALLGSAALLLGLAYAARGPRVRRPGVPPRLGNIRVIVARPAFWVVVLLFVLCVGVEAGIYNLVPAFLVQERGMSRESANLVLSGTRAVSLLTLPLTGLVIKRIGYQRTLALFLIGTGTATLLSGHGPLWWTIAMLTLQPMFVVCFFPVGFAVLSMVCPKATSDLAVSLCVMCSSIMGLGVIPGLLAWFGERCGLGLAFSLFGGLMLASSILAIHNLRIPKSA
ncbi:MAG: MFS transporter [Deltaproteobacteria bacterium]|nr:MFS transporter [Deltaproteobacteria bacterium]